VSVPKWHGIIFFAIQRLKLNFIMATFATAVYRYALLFFNNPAIFAHHFPLNAHLIYNKSNGTVTNVWGVHQRNSATILSTQWEQQVYCSGHKHNHSIKFQAVVTPDVPGSQHYSHLLAESNLIPLLCEVIPPGQPNYATYGDSAYAQCRVLIVGFGYPLPYSCEAQWNTEMSKVREGVEWMFGRIATLWKTSSHQTSWWQQAVFCCKWWISVDQTNVNDRNVYCIIKAIVNYLVMLLYFSLLHDACHTSGARNHDLP
jgi:hypothetical protein